MYFVNSNYVPAFTPLIKAEVKSQFPAEDIIITSINWLFSHKIKLKGVFYFLYWCFLYWCLYIGVMFLIIQIRNILLLEVKIVLAHFYTEIWKIPLTYTGYFLIAANNPSSQVEEDFMISLYKHSFEFFCINAEDINIENLIFLIRFCSKLAVQFSVK